MIEWILMNKEWLFSGIGLVVISLIFKLIINKGNKNIDINETINNDKKICNNKIDNCFKKFDVYEVVDRFVEVYESHNIKLNQIPIFVDDKFKLKMSDFKSKESILEILSDELLDYTARTFRIQRSWLDGTSDFVYNTDIYYKNVGSCIKLISDLNCIYEYDLNLYFFKSSKLNPNWYHKKGNHVVMLLEVPIKMINDTMIYSYIPMKDIWLWGYWRSRYQIKSIIWACVELKIAFLSGRDMDFDVSKGLAAGRILPNKFIKYIDSSCSWYPEDYSGNAGLERNLEVDEIPKVHRYIVEQKYHNYLDMSEDELNFNI